MKYSSSIKVLPTYNNNHKRNKTIRGRGSIILICLPAPALLSMQAGSDNNKMYSELI